LSYVEPIEREKTFYSFWIRGLEIGTFLSIISKEAFVDSPKLSHETSKTKAFAFELFVRQGNSRILKKGYRENYLGYISIWKQD
jgi:hypothetical protein